MTERRMSKTCLAVLRDSEGKLLFAGDRRISWGHRYQEGVRSKVLKRNGVLFAGTGSAYLCDLICELAEVPDIPEKIDGFTYIHTHLYETILQTLTLKGMADKETRNVTTEQFAHILVGVKGELFIVSIGPDGIGVDAMNAPYADGCGGAIAIGSLNATKYLEREDLERILQKGYKVRTKKKTTEELQLILALISAAEHSNGCDASIDIVRED